MLLNFSSWLPESLMNREYLSRDVIAGTTIAMIIIPGKCDLNKSIYCCHSSKGINTKPAINNLKVTNKIGQKSTAEIFINIKALPHIAASIVSKNQSFDSMK